MCHALNNVAASLFASLSHLDSLAPSGPAAKAGQSVAAACAGTRALAAAAYLFSLDGRLAQGAPGVGALAFRIDRAAFQSLAEALGEVAAVECASTWPPLRAIARVDIDTLSAVLLCLAFDLRRSARPGARIVLRVAIDAPDHEAGSLARFELATLGDAAPNRIEGRQSRPHLCALALEHAATVLPLEAAVIDAVGAAGRQLRLACVVRAEADDGAMPHGR